jgi:nitrite reductase/ring-hydroxylating ferredoxin subunit
MRWIAHDPRPSRFAETWDAAAATNKKRERMARKYLGIARLPSAASPPCGRRRFLGGAVGCLVASACSSPAGSTPAFGDAAAGNVASLTVGDVKVVPGVSACVARDAQGIYAMTLTCTHQACDMSTQGTVSPAGIVCGCHGSEFDVHGDVVRGPASSALEHYAVSADAQGNLTVHGGSVVDPSTRLAP